MVDSRRVQAGAHRVRKRAGLSREPVGAHPLHGTIRVLLGPQVEKRRRVGHAAYPSRAGSLRRDQPFRLEASEDTVRQSDRHARFAGEVLDLPFARRLEQQRLGRDAALAREPGVRLWARSVTASTTLPLGVEEEPRELDVGVAQTVDDGHAVALEDLARFRGRRARDEQEAAAAEAPGLLDELPSGGGVDVPPDLHRDTRGRAREPEHGVAPAVPGAAAGVDGQPGDLPQDPQRLRIEPPLDSYRCFHFIAFFTIPVNIS